MLQMSEPWQDAHECLIQYSGQPKDNSTLQVLVQYSSVRCNLDLSPPTGTQYLILVGYISPTMWVQGKKPYEQLPSHSEQTSPELLQDINKRMWHHVGKLNRQHDECILRSLNII